MASIWEGSTHVQEEFVADACPGAHGELFAPLWRLRAELLGQPGKIRPPSKPWRRPRTSSPAAVALLGTNNGKAFKSQISLFLGYNGMKKMDAFDFNAYPVAGFKADRIENIKLNSEFQKHQLVHQQRRRRSYDRLERY